jgi:hypothetical protein
VFARQFWFLLLQKVGLHDLSPQLGDTSFDDWLARINDTVNGQTQKGLNSLVISGPGRSGKIGIDVFLWYFS